MEAKSACIDTNDLIYFHPIEKLLRISILLSKIGAGEGYHHPLKGEVEVLEEQYSQRL